jgi:heme-degrading monooxygenase HmoA
MVIRVWRGQTPKWRGEQYEAIFRKTGLAGYRATPGNRGAYLLRRDLGDQWEYLAVSKWDSLDAVKQYAGEDYMRARRYKEEEELFTVFNTVVEHFEIILQDS